MQIPPFELERYFARWEFHVRHVLCASDPESLQQAELLDLADEECSEWWRTLSLGYTESQGHPRLRAAISELYEHIEAEQVIALTGAQEGILLAMMALLRPTDEVVVVTPAYQSLHEVARSMGAAVIEVPLERHPWALSLEALRRSFTSRTRLLVLNFPNNPTGAVLSPAEFAAILQLCDDHGTYLFADEVYRLLEYDGTPRLPAAADVYPRALSLGVLSKAFGLAGLRVGWIATQDEALHSRLAELKDYTTICGSAPAEVLATIALRARDRLLPRVQAIIRRNLALLDGFFERHAAQIAWVKPRAGCVAAPRLHHDAEPFIESLVRKHGVLLLPGRFFGLPPDYFRLGFGRRDMPEALALLEQHIVEEATRR